jgi:hypothetical protein
MKCLECQAECKNKYCSLKCQATLRRKENIQLWLDGKLSAVKGKVLNVKVFVREYLIEKAGNKCSKCGWDKINPITNKCPLEINHVDGDSSNSCPTNLEVICPNCHALTPNFRNLNKGSKRNRSRESESN